MSDDSCISCKLVVRPRQEALQCGECQKWQHRTCKTGISRDEYRQAVRQSIDIEWRCTGCSEPDHTETSIVVDQSFQIPDAVREDSIVEEPMEPVMPDNNVVQYKVVDEGSTRGKRKLCDTDGFSYTVKKQKNDHVLWRCTKRTKTINCPATIIQDGDDFKQGLKDHIHPAEPGCVIAVQIKKEIKSQAKQAVFGQSAKTIVDSVLREHADVNAPEHSRPKPASLQRTCNRVTASLRPNEPKNLDFELDLDFLAQHAPNFTLKDIAVANGNRHLIFYTERQLQLLAKAKTWYMDGTFKLVNAPWKQMFSIHAFVRSGDSMKQIPLVFCFMSGKSKDDYYEVLRCIDRRLPDDIQLRDFVVDFEAGLWQALRKRFPHQPIQGCVFHWTQAVFRKIQEHGLQTAYNNQDTVYSFLRQVMALPFLPPEHIPDTFRQLETRATDPSVLDVMDYIYDTWIRGSVFNIDNWSIFMSAVRTNNDVEGWHNRINKKVTANAPVPFYVAIQELHKEATDIPLHIKLVSEGKLQRHQRRQTRKIQGRVFDAWEQYCAKDISASRLLKKCASIYGPPAK